MAWTTPATFTDGNVLTGSQLNAMRDNFNESAPAKATGGGGLIMANGVNSIVQRTPNSGEALSTNSTSTTSYSTFTSGPDVPLTTGSIVWCFVTAFMENTTVNEACKMSIQAIGSHSPGDSTALTVTSSTVNADYRGTALLRISGLTPGVNTFTAVYRVTGGTGSFSHRRVDVLPLG